jgi:hypothetical protein
MELVLGAVDRARGGHVITADEWAQVHEAADALRALWCAGIRAGDPDHALDVLVDSLVGRGRVNRGTATALRTLRRALGLRDA